MLSCNYNQTIFSAETFVRKRQGAVTHYWRWSSWEKFKTSSYKLHFGHGLLTALQAQAPPPRMRLPAVMQPLCPILSAHLFCSLSPPRRFPPGHQQRSWGSSPPTPLRSHQRGASIACSPGASIPRSLNSACSWWRWRETAVLCHEALSPPSPKPGVGCSFDETCAWSCFLAYLSHHFPMLFLRVVLPLVLFAAFFPFVVFLVYPS